MSAALMYAACLRAVSTSWLCALRSELGGGGYSILVDEEYSGRSQNSGESCRVGFSRESAMLISPNVVRESSGGFGCGIIDFKTRRRL